MKIFNQWATGILIGGCLALIVFIIAPKEAPLLLTWGVLLWNTYDIIRLENKINKGGK